MQNEDGQSNMQLAAGDRIMKLKAAIKSAENGDRAPLAEEAIRDKVACFAAVEARLDELCLLLGDQAAYSTNTIYAHQGVNCITYRQYNNLLKARGSL